MQPARSIKSCHRLIGVTNDRHFANTERDDRRFSFFEISDERKQDHEYFNRRHASFKDGNTLLAFVYQLKNLDLSHFNVRNRPITSEHTEQKIASLEPLDAFILDILEAGSFNKLTPIDMTNGAFIRTEQFRVEFLEFYPNAGKHKPITDKYITSHIMTVLPSAKRDQQRVGVDNRRGLIWPPLDVCRQEFEKYLNCKIPWPDAREVPKKSANSVTCVIDEPEATFANTFDAHYEHISEAEQLQ